MKNREFPNAFRVLTAGLLATALVAGCASYSGSTLVPGKSTAAEVESTMGAPADKVNAAGGEAVWFYPRGPAGRQTFAVRIGPDGVVRAVEPRLTMENIGKLAVDRSTTADARSLLGPPYMVRKFPQRQRDAWEYKMIEGGFQTNNFKVLTLEFSGDGILRQSLFQDDFIDLGGHCMDC